MIKVEHGLGHERLEQVFGEQATDPIQEKIELESAVALDIASVLCRESAGETDLGYDGVGTRMVSEPFPYTGKNGEPIEMRLGLLRQETYRHGHRVYDDGLETVEILVKGVHFPDRYLKAGQINRLDVRADVGMLRTHRDIDYEMDVVMGCIIAANKHLRAAPEAPQKTSLLEKMIAATRKLTSQTVSKA